MELETKMATVLEFLNNLWGLGTFNWQAGGIDSFESIPGLLKCLASEMEVTDGRC